MKIKNYSILKMLVLEEILGNKTTLEISHELGFKFDKYKRWMTDEKILKWDEFELLCRKMELNLTDAYDIFKFTGEDISITPENIFNRLKDFNIFDSNQALADHLKSHISVIKRYTKGETIPNVETIFKLIGFKSNILAFFLRRLFAENITHPLLSKWIEEDTKAVFFESKFPISSMIEAALYLEIYNERTMATNLWLSELLELKLEEIDAAFENMLASKMIVQVSTDIYKPTNETTNLNGLHIQEIIPFVQYLNHKFIKNLDKRKNPEYKLAAHRGAMSYRVVAMSIESMDKINEIIMKVNDDILKVLEEDEKPKLEARAILLQTFSLSK